MLELGFFLEEGRRGRKGVEFFIVVEKVDGELRFGDWGWEERLGSEVVYWLGYVM